MIEQLYGFVTSLWLVLLVVIFSGIVVWVLWPTRQRKTQMQNYADIPFREAPKLEKSAGRDDKKDG
ncbi:cbb3-type cytochrome oxidase subunit 3 [Algihabitans albus]|uniref:cbb3-type cytochrome oxidase subunit 3 n=1 Tax=Algihabitans albus TaxID=2164067 RepID=UPI000E5C6E0F|nr:cbb3-type cytochrome c oxidase subunit 3 [Algihabitans albus]